MDIQLKLSARDVTLLPEERPAPDPSATPERAFALAHDGAGYSLEFDGRRATVPDEEIRVLLTRVATGTSVEWQYSSDAEIRSTFRPLRRILQCINSTPSYQLFLAGFHVGDAIGFFDLHQVRPPAIADSFRYLVGNLTWTHGKKGRLFIIPDGYVTTDVVRTELIANGKVFCADFFLSNSHSTGHVETKLIVPYATPIGFNTKVHQETEDVWRRISDRMRREGGA